MYDGLLKVSYFNVGSFSLANVSGLGKSLSKADIFILTGESFSLALSDSERLIAASVLSSFDFNLSASSRCLLSKFFPAQVCHLTPTVKGSRVFLSFLVGMFFRNSLFPSLM